MSVLLALSHAGQCSVFYFLRGEARVCSWLGARRAIEWEKSRQSSPSGDRRRRRRRLSVLPVSLWGEAWILAYSRSVSVSVFLALPFKPGRLAGSFQIRFCLCRVQSQSQSQSVALGLEKILASRFRFRIGFVFVFGFVSVPTRLAASVRWRVHTDRVVWGAWSLKLEKSQEFASLLPWPR